jgi:hypothetical protein
MTDTKPESREMHQEIAELIAGVAKALAMSDGDTIAALENGEITLELGRDGNGNRFVSATYGDRTVQVYKGAIRQAAG